MGTRKYGLRKSLTLVGLPLMQVLSNYAVMSALAWIAFFNRWHGGDELFWIVLATMSLVQFCIASSYRHINKNRCHFTPLMVTGILSIVWVFGTFCITTLLYSYGIQISQRNGLDMVIIYLLHALTVLLWYMMRGTKNWL